MTLIVPILLITLAVYEFDRVNRFKLHLRVLITLHKRCIRPSLEFVPRVSIVDTEVVDRGRDSAVFSFRVVIDNQDVVVNLTMIGSDLTPNKPDFIKRQLFDPGLVLLQICRYFFFTDRL